MSLALDDLYREIILDHYRNPRNRGELTEPDIFVEGTNPLCGDEIALGLDLEEGRVEDIRFKGRGCSISQASASMMTEMIKGQPLEKLEELIASFKEMMHGEEPDAEAIAELGDLEALQGVKKFPVRIKCALLPWTTLDEALTTIHQQEQRG